MNTRENSYFKHRALFLVLFFLVACLLLGTFILFASDRWMAKTLPVDWPDSDTMYLDSWTGDADESAHIALFHDLYGCTASYRDADVLLMGNSQMLLGIRDNFKEFAEKKNLKYFVHAHGHNERGRFFLDVIKKHDIRNKLIIINLSSVFFSGGRSPYGAMVADLDWGQAWLRYWSIRIRWRVRTAAAYLLPDDLGRKLFSPRWLIFRNRETGEWVPLWEPKVNAPLKYDVNGRVFEEYLPFAREFMETMQAMGNRVVFIGVPANELSYKNITYFSDKLGVQTVIVRPEGMETADESHLTRESARRYCDALFPELGKIIDRDPVLGRR